MDPELTKLESAFNKKIEEWISKQGLLFQFSHDTGHGSIYPKISRLIIRLLILGVIGLIVFWFYLTSLPHTIAFKEDIQSQIQVGLNASKVKISSITRDKGGLLNGEMLISALSMGETKSSFFEDWFVMEEEVSAVGRRSVVEKRNMASLEGIHLSPLGIGDNYFSGWSANVIKVLKMELKLKTGAESDELALASYLSIFKEYETLKVDNIQVFDANLLWGYSDTTSGAIKGAQLNLRRGSNAWEIKVTGGTFSHGWLKDAEIIGMKVVCNRSGEVKIESANFKIGNGELNLKASIKIQSQPVLTGSYAFENVEVLDLIGDKYEDWLGGKIRGTGEMSGNLNSKEGIKTITNVQLNGSSKPRSNILSASNLEEGKNDSILIVRGDNFQLLKVMQISDPRNSYSLLRAHKGSLIIENQGMHSQITVNDLRFGSNDLILMRGKFNYSPSLEQDLNEKIDTSSPEGVALNSDPTPKQTEDEQNDSAKVVLRVFSGDLEMGVIPEAFESNAKVLKYYPIDNDTLRVWFKIKMEGQFEELTDEIGDKLFDIMQKDKNN